MLEFLVASLVVVASPGPGATYTIATTASLGWRLGWFAALGCTLGVAPHLIVASTGLSTVLRPGSTAFEVLRWAGVAYLVVLAIQAFRTCRPLRQVAGAEPPTAAAAEPAATATATATATAEPAPTASGVLRRAITMNLLNPKLTAFFLAFLPQFAASSSAPHGMSPTLLGVAFMAITFVVFLGYARLTHATRATVVSRAGRGRWFGGVVGTTYLALAGRLATP